MPLPDGTTAWPQYNTISNQFMELNSAGIKVITTPQKERIEKLLRDVFPARNQQKNADKGEEIIFRKRKKQIKIAMNFLINKKNYSTCHLLLLLEYANSLIISTQRYMFVTSQKAAVMCTLNRQLPNLFVQAIE